jgi:antitoxin component of RelBE/YafQ-DinJ toxin-antitoxin module
VAKGVTVKSRLNLKIDQDLKNWAMDYAKRSGTDVTKLITEYFIYLREQEQRQDAEYVEQI